MKRGSDPSGHQGGQLSSWLSSCPRALPQPLLGQQTLYLEGGRGDVSVQKTQPFQLGGAGGQSGSTHG